VQLAAGEGEGDDSGLGGRTVASGHRFGAAGGRLDRGRVERDGEYEGGGELLAGVVGELPGASGEEELDELVERAALGVGVGDLGCVAVDDGAAVVHRVGERGAGEHEPVE